MRARRLCSHHHYRNHAVPGRALRGSTPSRGNTIICWTFLVCRPSSRLLCCHPPEPPPVSHCAPTTAKALRPASTTYSALTQYTSRDRCYNDIPATAAAAKAKPVNDTQQRGSRPMDDQATTRGAYGINKTTSGGDKQNLHYQHLAVGVMATTPLDPRDTDGPAQLLPPPRSLALHTFTKGGKGHAMPSR